MNVATFTVHLASADCASEAQSLERVLHGAPGVRNAGICETAEAQQSGSQ